MNNDKIIVETLINIDSNDRNINPKNICISTNNITLPNNPLKIINSNLLLINYPNHNLQINDNITIENVKGYNKIITNNFYLINNFRYLLINIDNNMININYKDYINTLYININTFGDYHKTLLVNNIPFNSIIGIKQSLIYNDIPETYRNNMKNILLNILNIDSNIFLDYINENCIFIELPKEYINHTDDYYIINQTFYIEYLHINGIKLGYINSNYPINSINYQSNHEIYNVIDKNTIIIKLNTNGYINNTYIGGDNIKINKIVNIIEGYPNSNNYNIILNKTFNNIIDIRLVSTEFPYLDLLVKKNINDKFYWKHIEDGDYIYSITIDEGFYTGEQLLNKMNILMNNVERIISTNINPIYNIFNIIMEQNTHTISFYTYQNKKLPNSLSIRTITINKELYYILNIMNINNIINENDIITINNSTDVTFKINNNNNIQIFSVDNIYINKSHKVYSINNNTYDVILGNINEITITLVNYESAGGENIVIKMNSKSSFLFNKSDTIGNELGFNNVGNIYSITDYKFCITNSDSYIYDININSIGNEIDYKHGYFCFVGKYNYFYMYLNDIELIYTNNKNTPPAFAKILLNGNSGDILFNTFVKQSIYHNNINFPISNLYSLNIKFIYPDGNFVNFRNLNHSFTLKITEEKIKNNVINSKYINYNK
jgi:hypothetical protein